MCWGSEGRPWRTAARWHQWQEHGFGIRHRAARLPLCWCSIRLCLPCRESHGSQRAGVGRTRGEWRLRGYRQRAGEHRPSCILCPGPPCSLAPLEGLCREKILSSPSGLRTWAQGLVQTKYSPLAWKHVQAGAVGPSGNGARGPLVMNL